MRLAAGAVWREWSELAASTIIQAKQSCGECASALERLRLSMVESAYRHWAFADQETGIVGCVCPHGANVSAIASMIGVLDDLARVARRFEACLRTTGPEPPDQVVVLAARLRVSGSPLEELKRLTGWAADVTVRQLECADFALMGHLCDAAEANRKLVAQLCATPVLDAVMAARAALSR